MRFHMTHVTLEFHQVRSKWFMRLWYVRHKPCTYLASRLPLSLNGPNQASTWTTSPRSSIRCVQNDFWAYGMFSTNLQISCIDANTISKWTKTRFHMTHVTFEFHWVRPKWFLSLWYVRRKPQTFLASRLALYQMKLNQTSTWASSPRSTIGCVQNDFWAYGMFSTNHAPVLNRHQHFSKLTKTWFHMTHVS
jgi:hypothetical protein